jgi:iron complex outermembrane receptor protein
MKKLFNLTFLILVAGMAFAQQEGTLSGQVTEKDGKPLEFTSITVHHTKDSSLVKNGFSDESGKFLLSKIPFGSYFLKAGMVGFETFRSPAFLLSAENPAVDLKNIMLARSVNQLNEVTVIHKKPFIERQIDKLVVNVESNISMAGNNALEILDKIPGIRTDADGNVSVYGKQGVQIFMDGKPSNLSATDLANILRGVLASQIEKIEIITNPSAKYDAAGNMGIINLVMKKDKRFGTNGSFNTSVALGLHLRQNAGFNLNYRKNKLSLGANLTEGWGKRENRTAITRNFGQEASTRQFFDQKATTVSTFFTKNVKLTGDYYFNKKVVAGVSVGLINNRFNTNTWSLSDLKNASDEIQLKNRSDVSNKDKWNNYTVNANLKYTIDSLGKELTFDVDWLAYLQNLNQHSENSTPYTQSGEIIPPYNLRGDLPSVIHIRSFKADYVHPLTPKTKFEAGLKTSFVDNDGNARYYLETNQGEVVDESRTNHFLYQENINAAYLNFNTELNKTTIQLGLRGEYTHLKGNLLTYDTVFTRDYFKLFPTIYLSRTFAKKHSVTLNTGRRIQRPNYQDLNPFKFFLDLYTYREGNPNLQPQFSYNTELTYGYNQKIFVNFYLNRETKSISTVLSQNDVTKVAAQTQLNLNDGRTMGYNISAPVDFIKNKWTANLFFNHWNDRLWGKVQSESFDRSQSSFFIQASNNLIFKKDWTAEFGGYYISKQLYGTFVFNSQLQVNAGIQKKIFNKKGTLRLNANDIFLTQKQRMTVQYANVDMKLKRRLDSRFVTVAFSYNFGSSTVQGIRRRNGGADEEKNRIQAGTSA